MPRALKVFQARMGFYDTVVSASSQAAALRAWSSSRNLFKDGTAQVATDEKAINAALAQPEVPLKRAIGTNDPFSLNPGLPQIPDLPPDGKSATNRPKAKPAAPPPDRAALDAAERALHVLDDQWKAQQNKFRERRDAIEVDERIARERFSSSRSEAEQQLERERQAYKKAGGRVVDRR